MAEEANDVELAEITPDQFDGEEQETPTESSTETEEKVEAKAETETEEKPEVVEESEEKSDDENPETETEGESEAEETETEKPQSKAEERKTQLNTEIRDLVAQRNLLRTEIEKINAETYQPATEDELVDQGYDATEAKVEALRQQVEMRDYNEKVAEAQLTISSESQKVLDDFPMFNSDSEQYDKELADEAAELVQANLIQDPNTGQIIGSNVPIYKIYKTLAKASGISTAKGQIKGQKDTEKMLANADTASAKTAAKPKADPLTELWSEEL